MTKDVIKRLVADALNISTIEEYLIEIISDKVNYHTIAEAIWDQYENEIIEAAEEILPF